ncbi:hypothetical protein GE061_003181 [Apolygus lucorum]|uniref:Uncharacterized protein n=1 Tax=Apolygus lucorum TaxID=248454 RepID=A0A6A4JC03_APOLU|nr:hypothetical protein GE061_003177 [Apolygus lucorum]KAF6202778.1 hypothetical protein GE061_003181 [Apolygus lucorum]
MSEREPSAIDWDSNCGPNYDVTSFVNAINVQFCTIVEIGQGYCSLFLEFRTDGSCPDLTPGGVAEVYLGTCECSVIRTWEMCSLPLKKARPYECSFEEEPRLNTSEIARVHRRLCNPTMMVKEELNEPCDCSKQFDQRTLYPIVGFITCYRAPMPKSICTTHSVCGVANCIAKNLDGLAVVHCDPDCIGRQPFCEETGPISSRAPTVTSFWSQWTCSVLSNNVIEVSEAICLEKETHAPAFDCLGPGFYCCPSDTVCVCETFTTMSEMKVTRYKLNDAIFTDPDAKPENAANLLKTLPEPLRRHAGLLVSKTANKLPPYVGGYQNLAQQPALVPQRDLIQQQGPVNRHEIIQQQHHSASLFSNLTYFSVPSYLNRELLPVGGFLNASPIFPLQPYHIGSRGQRDPD